MLIYYKRSYIPLCSITPSPALIMNVLFMTHATKDIILLLICSKGAATCVNG